MIMDYIKLSWMIFELLTNREKFICRSIEEIKTGKHNEHFDKISEFLKSKYECDDVVVKIDNKHLVFALVNTEEDGNNIIDMVLKMLSELSIFLSDDKIFELKDSLSKVEFVRTEGENNLYIGIPIYDEKILEKIKEVVTNE